MFTVKQTIRKNVMLVGIILFALVSLKVDAVVNFDQRPHAIKDIEQLQVAINQKFRKEGDTLSKQGDDNTDGRIILIKLKDASVGVALSKSLSEHEKDYISPNLNQLNKKYKVERLIPLIKNIGKNNKIENLMCKDTSLFTPDEKGQIDRYKKIQDCMKASGLDRLYKVEVDIKKGETLRDVIQQYQALEEVEYAEPNYKVKILNTPNDPLYPLMWSLNNTGQAYPGGQGIEDVDINAPEAWDIATGSSDVIIAVIDTGVDYTHRDIDDNMWINEEEANGTPGIDDDENGFVDDIYGYDFCNSDPNEGYYDPDPIDDHGHGTHCAGTIAAEGNNGTDIVGVNWQAKIMALKFLDAGGSGYTDDAIEAIIYAVENGAQVLSNSWGGGGFEQALQDTIDFTHNAGVIFIAAAGNEYLNYPTYPSAYEYVLAVAATDSKDQKASFSNYGDWVDIAAPGVDILSLRAAGTAMGSVYDDYTTVASGTSMACPHVAGACGLLLAHDPNLDPEDLEFILEHSSSPIDDGICESDGRLDIYNSLIVVNGMGILQLDKEKYSGSDEIVITLYDRNLLGQTSQNVTVETDSGDYEQVSLSVMSSGWSFTASINTSEQPVIISDGYLQVSHGDTITVSYDDLDNGLGNPNVFVQLAIADCQGPVISNHEIDIPGPEPKVVFETDEPSTVLVRYGQSSSNLDKTSENDSFEQAHLIRLTEVVPSTTYYYQIEAEDVVGNVTVDNNGGLLYSFTTDTPQDIYVPADCNTIQRAIDICWDGQIVYVADGNYNGEGNYDIDLLGRAITVKSENGPDNCIIDCRGLGRGFIIFQQDANVVIEGFTIRNGHTRSNPNPSDILDGLVGGGLYCRYAGGLIKNCVFVDNSALMYGGGVFAEDCDSLEMIDCVFLNNIARKRSGGAAYSSVDNLFVQNCKMFNNWSEQSGGAIYAYGDTKTIEQCHIVNNSSYVGAGCNFPGGDVSILRSIIKNNSADSYAGGLLVQGYTGLNEPHKNLLIENSIISNNSAMANVEYESTDIKKGGGGIYLVSYINAILKNNTICNNYAGFCDYVYYSGGGIASYGNNSISMDNCILWGNVSETIADQISLNAFELSDGWRPSDMTISYSDVEGGQSGIYKHPESTLDWGDGNIDSDPLFALDNDYHILNDSPCKDSGTNTPTNGLPTQDLDGNARPLNSVADMGAYEYNSDYPSIGLSEKNVEFINYTFTPDPNSQILYIRNTGGGTLLWEIIEEIPWLDVYPTFGISTNNINSFTITVDTTGLAAGNYRGSMLVESENAINSPITVYINLHVGGNLYVPSQYPTIQAGIDAAVDGDTILVADGTYTNYGNRDLCFYGKAITLKSENGPDNCIIDPDGKPGEAQAHRAFYLWETQEGPDTIIDGFTLINGYASSEIYGNAPYIPFMGGAVFVQYASPIFKNCNVIDNRAEGWGEGGGMYLLGSSSNIENCLVQDNFSSSSGGGISLLAVDANEIESLIKNCTITGNSSIDGGGIWSADLNKIQDTIICNNNAASNGGGILSFGNIQDIENCTIVNNSAMNKGGGIYSQYGWEDEVFEIKNTILWDNSAVNGGSEITVVNGPEYVDSKLSIQYCDIKGGQDYIETDPNTILTWGDGNIDIDPEFVDSANDDYHLNYQSPCHNSGDPNTFEDLSRTDIDGEARIWQERIDIGADEVYGLYNESTKQWSSTIQSAIDAASNGNVITLMPGTYTGEGNRDIDFSGKAVTLQSIDPSDWNIVESTVINCEATELDSHRGFCFNSGETTTSVLDGLTITNAMGESVYISEFDVYVYAGGAVFCDNASNPTIRNCIMRNNIDLRENSDGAAIACYNGSNAFIENCVMTNNICTNGIVSTMLSSPTVLNCNINNNTEISAPISCYMATNVIIKNCTMTNNQVSTQWSGTSGGVLCWNSVATIENCTMMGNTASNGGGIYLEENSNVIIRNCLIADNIASFAGGGICSYFSNAVINNCTIVNNNVGGTHGYGGGINIMYGLLLIDNCILWGNADQDGNQVKNLTPNLVTFSYCDIQDSGGSTDWDTLLGIDGGGNIDSDPLFIDPLTADFHLQCVSPCINAGDPNENYLGQYDIDFEDRVIGECVDIGADEFNGYVGSVDLADSDESILGTVSGSYLDTHTSNNVYQSIVEIAKKKKKANYTILEHKWTIDVTGGDNITFYIESYHSPNTEGDDFIFAYSTNDRQYTDMLTVTKTIDDDTHQSYELPSNISGTVYIRVTDTNQSTGNSKDTVFIDYMSIVSE